MGCGSSSQEELQNPSYHFLQIIRSPHGKIKTTTEESGLENQYVITEAPQKKENIFRRKQLPNKSILVKTEAERDPKSTSQVSIQIQKKTKTLVIMNDATNSIKNDERISLIREASFKDQPSGRISSKRQSAGSEFSFTNSPQNQTQPNHFLLRFNQKRKGDESNKNHVTQIQNEDTPNLNGNSKNWLNFGHATQNLSQFKPTSNIEELQSLPEESNHLLSKGQQGSSHSHSTQPDEKLIPTGKFNLLEAIRNKKLLQKVDTITNQRQQVRQNPKFNLLKLIKQIKEQESPLTQKQSLSFIPVDDSLPQSALLLRQQLRLYYEAQGGMNTLSPIYSLALDSAKMRDDDDFMKLTPTSHFQLQPIQNNKLHQNSILHAQRQHNLLDQQSLLQSSFIVQQEESRLDLDLYTLQVEDMDYFTSQQKQQMNIGNSGQKISQFDQQFHDILSPQIISKTEYSSPQRQIQNNDKNMSMNSLKNLPSTPTYPKQSETNPSDQDMMNSKQIGDFRMYASTIPYKKVAQSQKIDRHASFSLVNNLEIIIETSKLLKPQSTESNSKQLLRRQSTTMNKPIETSIMDKSRDEEGKKNINNYVVLQELGRGGFGKVRLVYCSQTNQYFAMKIANKQKLKKKLLSRQKSVYTLLEQEVAILKKMDHPNVVKLMEVIDDPDEAKLYLIMELVKKGAVNSKAYWKDEGHIIDWDNGMLPPMISLLKIRKYIRDFLQGLDYLHNYAMIIHRDIKPDNLLIDMDDNLKIADFGVAHMIDDEGEEITGDTGTKTFLPPELFLGQKVNGKAADIWATGITFYILAFGRAPFDGKTLDLLKSQIINSQISYPDDSDPGLCDFIECCLQKDPMQRSTLEQLGEHKWVTNNGEEPINQPDYEDKLEVTDVEIRSAITRFSFKGIVKLKAKLKHQLNLSRQRIKSRSQVIHE